MLDIYAWKAEDQQNAIPSDPRGLDHVESFTFEEFKALDRAIKQYVVEPVSISFFEDWALTTNDLKQIHDRVVDAIRDGTLQMRDERSACQRLYDALDSCRRQGLGVIAYVD